jgi:hypothetical protein
VSSPLEAGFVAAGAAAHDRTADSAATAPVDAPVAETEVAIFDLLSPKLRLVLLPYYRSQNAKLEASSELLSRSTNRDDTVSKAAGL